MNDLISVIVPVYNSEKYIQRCLDSLILQSYKNLEIIVINDGSKDGSDGIITKYAVEDSRIVYHKQENKGIGLTRNQGVELAHGSYLCFVDSDDYVESTYIEKLYKQMIESDAEITWCNYTHVFQGQQKMIVQNEEDLFTFEYPCLWNKMYKTSLFIDNDILFPDAWYEDLATVPRVLLLSRKNVHLNESLYYYCQHENSITTTFSIHASDMDLVLDILNDFFSKINRNDLDISGIQNYITVFHGLCGTVFRMMLSKDHTSKEICDYYFQLVDKLNGKRFDAEIFMRLPLKYKIFYLILWKWSIPVVRYMIILFKK